MILNVKQHAAASLSLFRPVSIRYRALGVEYERQRKTGSRHRSQVS
jgi:hypothetical protein